MKSWVSNTYAYLKKVSFSSNLKAKLTTCGAQALFWFFNFLLAFVFHSWSGRVENAIIAIAKMQPIIIGCKSSFKNAYYFAYTYIHLVSFFCFSV